MVTSIREGPQSPREHHVSPLQQHMGMDDGLEEGQAVGSGRTLDCLLPGPMKRDLDQTQEQTDR